MNFVKIVKKKPVKENEIELIQSQAETEVGHILSKSEQSLPFSRFPQDHICRQILKVCMEVNFLQLITFM